MENEVAGFTMLVAIGTLLVIFFGLHNNTKRIDRDTQGNTQFQKHIEAMHIKQSKLHKHKHYVEPKEDLKFYLFD